MTSLSIKSKVDSLSVDVSSIMPQTKMTTEQFYAFCQDNRELRIERTAEGEVIVIPPASSDTGNRNARIAQQLANWADQDGTGEVFDSSAGFTLPNGATRSPDASWVQLERWNALSAEQKRSFAPLCPDFVIELRSSSDTLKSLKEKMEEYIDNGVVLGLLVDRKQQKIHVYRAGQDAEVLSAPSSVDCNPEMPGLRLQMKKIW